MAPLAFIPFLRSLFQQDSSMEIVEHLMVATLAMTLVYLTLYQMVPVVAPDVKREYRGSFADNLFNIVYLPVISFLASHASYMLGMQGAAARWTGENRSSYWFLVLYIAKNFMRSVSSVLLGDKKKGMWLIHIHHVISISCFAVGLFLHRLHFFGAMDGMCEISIIFLNNKFLYRDFGIAKGALYRVNLLALAVSWIATRLIAFPLWLALFLNDYYHHPMYAQGVSMFEMVVYPATTLIIW